MGYFCFAYGIETKKRNEPERSDRLDYSFG